MNQSKDLFRRVKHTGALVQLWQKHVLVSIFISHSFQWKLIIITLLHTLTFILQKFHWKMKALLQKTPLFFLLFLFVASTSIKILQILYVIPTVLKDRIFGEITVFPLVDFILNSLTLFDYLIFLILLIFFIFVVFYGFEVNWAKWHFQHFLED